MIYRNQRGRLNQLSHDLEPAGVYILTIYDLNPSKTGTLNAAALSFDPAIPIPFEYSPAIWIGALGAIFVLKKLISKTRK